MWEVGLSYHYKVLVKTTLSMPLRPEGCYMQEGENQLQTKLSLYQSIESGSTLLEPNQLDIEVNSAFLLHKMLEVALISYDLERLNIGWIGK